MQKYRIQAETLTDFMMGSGESVPGIVDMDCRFDSCGLPYMNAKTLKGHIREQMERILSVTGDVFQGITADSILGAEDPSAKKAPGRIFFSDLCLPDGVQGAVKQAIAAGDVTADEIQDSLTFIQTSTGIDPVTGTAQAHMLRKARLIRRGLIFVSDVYTADLNPRELDLFRKSVRAVQHIGTFKSKGKGAVRCRLLTADGEREAE